MSLHAWLAPLGVSPCHGRGADIDLNQETTEERGMYDSCEASGHRRDTYGPFAVAQIVFAEVGVSNGGADPSVVDKSLVIGVFCGNVVDKGPAEGRCGGANSPASFLDVQGLQGRSGWRCSGPRQGARLRAPGRLPVRHLFLDGGRPAVEKAAADAAVAAFRPHLGG